MPGGFGDGGIRETRKRRDSVVWLRTVSSEGGRAIRAAFLETSLRGEPLGFAFIGIGLRGAPGDPAARSLVASLLRASATSPSLLFAVAEEAPGALNVSLPFGRISAHLRPAGEGAVTWEGDLRTRLSWAAGPPCRDRRPPRSSTRS